MLTALSRPVRRPLHVPSGGGGGGGTQTWGSNWSYGTGNTTTPLTDGNRFEQQACGTPNAQGSIIAGSGVGWTLTDNVYRCQMNGSDCVMVEKSDVYPASTTHWGRFFWRNDETQQGQTHPTGYNNIHGSEAIQAVPWQRCGDLGASGYHRISVGTGGGYPNNRFYSTDLLNGTWYRYEWKMEFLTATTFRFWPRVYNMAGALLLDSDDFTIDGGGLTLTTHWASASTTLGDGDSQVEDARDFGLGNEGPDGAASSGEYWYYAALAFSETDWVGDSIEEWV